MLQCNRLTGHNRSLYSLRHTYATFSLTYKRGVDIHLLATQTGTRTLMIERHYSHLITRMRSATLAGGRWSPLNLE
jgi:integrase